MALFASVHSGCSLLATFGDRAGHDAGDGRDDGGVGSSDGEAPSSGDGCPGTAGPAMVQVGAYCIDSTEVTNRDYNAFLAAGVDVSGQSARCGWNDSFLPDGPLPADDAHASLPVVRVDWCDAAAYCAWAGKRLCGKIGGGTLDVKSARSASASQWYAACSRGGDRAYPYADDYQSGACQADVPAGPAPVGSLQTCEGGYAGVFDMSGNVAEWEDACETSSEGSGSGGSGTNDTCLVRGGSYAAHDKDDLSCEGNDTLAAATRNARHPDVGFRCCGP